ncbi:TetR/AcrR family transcriptional regulator [Phytopseudomonas daroniae]|uniref:TetR/AcrR family transcriptional regulator n=1 Tax=Phytopseudomonas daroniae TaxID=2487519 RepID=UPI0010383040|nr:TetR/AcrR family transcriptional regulator [Pseudomonas daroniae]TBU77336.1 TetR family transcriptional regulator [Pseudomonas daroniae]
MVDESTLRADAQRNRERILAAAEAVFLEKGAGASLEDVAKRAGVGIGTLYRRFPTREALLAAACSARFVSLAESSRARSAGLDPGAAVRAYLEDLVTDTNIYRNLAASLGTVLQKSGTPGCHAMTEEGQRLLRRAQEAGTIRQDVGFDDLVYVATAISLAAGQDESSKSRTPHLIDLFLNGISVR